MSSRRFLPTIWVAARWASVLLACATATPVSAAQAQGQGAAGGGVVPVQDQPAVTDQAPGATSIPVTLTGGFITQRLPFDVPFYVTGTAPSATRVDLYVYRVVGRTVVSQLAADLQDTFTCMLPNGPTPVSRSAARPGATGSFTLLVDALDPNRYYIFCFLSRGPVPTTEIEASIRQILADSLTALPDQGDVGLQLARAFHDRLAMRIAQLGQQRSVPAVIPEGNIFHPNTVVALGSDFALLLGDVANPWRNLAPTGPVVTLYTGALGRLRAAGDAATAAGSPALQFLSQTDIDALPTGLALPERSFAVTSKTPFDVSRYNVTPSVTALTTAISNATTAKNQAAVNLLNSLLAEVKTVGGLANNYASSYETMRLAAQRVVDQTVLESRAVAVSLGSSVLTADLSRNAYVSMDAGIAYPWRLENMVFYVGTNIYFRPINKDAPLRYKGSFLHRFALTIGVTTTVKDDSRRALDLRPTDTNDDTSNSLLIGGGIRVTPSIRLGAGALVFKENDPNPLVTQTSVTMTPYVALAADVNVAAILKSFFPSNPE